MVTYDGFWGVDEGWDVAIAHDSGKILVATGIRCRRGFVYRKKTFQVAVPFGARRSFLSFIALACVPSPQARSTTQESSDSFFWHRNGARRSIT